MEGTYRKEILSHLVPKEEVENINNALLVDFFKGRCESSDYFPQYFFDNFGTKWQERLLTVMNLGYLRKSTPYESLEFATLPVIKEILKSNNLKVSGKKSELISRIKENLSPSLFDNMLSAFYITTDIGNYLLGDYGIYILNKSMQNEFLVGEIYQTIKFLKTTKKSPSTNEILYELLAQRTKKHILDKDWGSLCCNMYALAHFMEKLQLFKSSLSFLFARFYLELSGLDNGNYVSRYQRLRIPPLLIKDIERVIVSLNIDENEARSIFFSSADKADSFIPFSYFSKDVSFDIMVDILNGKDFNPDKYAHYANTPSTQSKTYTYYE